MNFIYLQGLKKYISFCGGRKDFMQCAQTAKAIKARNGAVQVEVEVLESMTNDSGNMHTGCIFNMIDIFTTAATMTTGKIKPPVSVNFQVDYFDTIKIGELLTIDAKVLSKDGPLTYVEACIRRKINQEVVARGGQMMSYVASPGGNQKI